MISLDFLRNNPDVVKENIKKKFQFHKVELVDKAIELDKQIRAYKQEGDNLRASRNSLSSQIGLLMREKKIDEANQIKQQVVENNKRVDEIEKLEEELSSELNAIMMTIPNIIADDVPVGKDDSENVEEQRFLEPVVPSYEIPYHADIIEALNGADFEAARRTSGTGFYYLCGDIARLHSAILSYARDFMINKGFTYCIPPFMIHGNVVQGVMSFDEMQNMMYKIEGEDLYLIGTSEHSMIGRFLNTIIPEEKLPLRLTSYSPCFRKEIGAHGIEERGIYRVHQFEKQEMIVICKPEES